MKANEQAGRKAFQEFAAGDWPFKGNATPKNPHPRGSTGYNEWRNGYDAEMCAWFA